MSSINDSATFETTREVIEVIDVDSEQVILPVPREENDEGVETKKRQQSSLGDHNHTDVDNSLTTVGKIRESEFEHRAKKPKTTVLVEETPTDVDTPSATQDDHNLHQSSQLTTNSTLDVIPGPDGSQSNSDQHAKMDNIKQAQQQELQDIEFETLPLEEDSEFWCGTCMIDRKKSKHVSETTTGQLLSTKNTNASSPNTSCTTVFTQDTSSCADSHHNTTSLDQQITQDESVSTRSVVHDDDTASQETQPIDVDAHDCDDNNNNQEAQLQSNGSLSLIDDDTRFDAPPLLSPNLVQTNQVTKETIDEIPDSSEIDCLFVKKDSASKDNHYNGSGSCS